MPQPTCVLMQAVRAAVLLDQHALDQPAVVQAQQQLVRAVGRRRDGVRRGWRTAERFGQFGRSSFGRSDICSKVGRG